MHLSIDLIIDSHLIIIDLHSSILSNHPFRTKAVLGGFGGGSRPQHPCLLPPGGANLRWRNWAKICANLRATGPSLGPAGSGLCAAKPSRQIGSNSAPLPRGR